MLYVCTCNICTKEKAQHGTAKTIPVSSRVIMFSLVGAHLTSGQKEKRKKSNRRASLSTSYAARPSRDHLATDAVRVKLSFLSAAVSPGARLT